MDLMHIGVPNSWLANKSCAIVVDRRDPVTEPARRADRFSKTGSHASVGWNGSESVPRAVLLLSLPPSGSSMAVGCDIGVHAMQVYQFVQRRSLFDLVDPKCNIPWLLQTQRQVSDSMNQSANIC